MKLLELIKKDQKLITMGLAAATVLLAGSLPLVSNSSYNKGIIKGHNDGVSEGIVQGRVGYVKGYEGGKIRVEGYNGMGVDFDCFEGKFFFSSESPAAKSGYIKGDVGYNYNEVESKWSSFADWQIRAAESTCRALGYRP